MMLSDRLDAVSCCTHHSVFLHVRMAMTAMTGLTMDHDESESRGAACKDWLVAAMSIYCTEYHSFTEVYTHKSPIDSV